jgi:hypothetical protein
MAFSSRNLGIISAEDVGRMKKDAILITTSRGPLIDEGALVVAVWGGRIVAGWTPTIRNRCHRIIRCALAATLG